MEHIEKSKLMANLKPREQLSYGIADIGAAISTTAINFFLLHFLVNIVGLRPALAGGVLLIGRLIDAITDPLMGVISDRTRAIWGKRKPYIFWGAIPFGITFALIWTIPEVTSSQMLTFWLAAGILTLHTTVFTVVQVPYLALTPELAPTYAGRTVLTSYRAGLATFASLIAAASPPILVASLNNFKGLEQDAHFGWIIMGIIFGTVSSLGYLIMILGVKEPRRKVKLVQQNLWQNYSSAFSVTGFLGVLLIFMLVTIALSIVASLLPFYLNSVSKISPEWQTFVMGLLFISAILSLPLWNFLSKHYGKRLAFTFGLVFIAINLPLLMWVSAGTNLSTILVTFTTLTGIGLGAVLLFPWAMLPDVVEFDEFASGNRREGVLYAIFTFGQKVATALAIFLNAQVLELINYQANAPTQSEFAKQGIMIMTGPIAALVFILAMILVWRYPINQIKHKEVSEGLKRLTGKRLTGKRLTGKQ